MDDEQRYELEDQREYEIGGPNEKGRYLVGYATEKGFKTILKTKDRDSALEIAGNLQQYYDAGCLV